MKYQWLGSQAMLSDVQDRTLKEVLLEYEGPHLVIFQNKNQRFLGLRVDDDDQHTAWLESPLSALEEDALKFGELAVRDALIKEQMWLVEFTHAGALSVAREIKASDVPVDILPEPHALLPTYVRSAYAAPLVKSPELHIGSRDAHAGNVPLKSLGLIATSMQQLWDAFCTSI